MPDSHRTQLDETQTQEQSPGPAANEPPGNPQPASAGAGQVYEALALAEGAVLRISRILEREEDGEEVADLLYVGQKALRPSVIEALWGGGRFLLEVLSGEPGAMMTQLSAPLEIEGEPEESQTGVILPTGDEADDLAETFIWHRWPAARPPGTTRPPLPLAMGTREYSPCGEDRGRDHPIRAAVALGAFMNAYGVGALADDIYTLVEPFMRSLGSVGGKLGPMMMPMLTRMAADGGPLVSVLARPGQGKTPPMPHIPGVFDMGPEEAEELRRQTIASAKAAGLPLDQVLERFDELFPPGTFRPMGDVEGDPHREARMGRGEPGFGPDRGSSAA